MLRLRDLAERYCLEQLRHRLLRRLPHGSYEIIPNHGRDGAIIEIWCQKHLTRAKIKDDKPKPRALVLTVSLRGFSRGVYPIVNSGDSTFSRLVADGYFAPTRKEFVERMVAAYPGVVMHKDIKSSKSKNYLERYQHYLAAGDYEQRYQAVTFSSEATVSAVADTIINEVTALQTIYTKTFSNQSSSSSKNVIS